MATGTMNLRKPLTAPGSIIRTVIFAGAAFLLTALIVACGDDNGDATDDTGIDDQPTVGVGAGEDAADDDEAGVPPLFELVEAESDDGEQRVAAVAYSQQPTEQMDALLEGELTRSGECLGVGIPFENGFVSVVWPAGFTVGFEDGEAVLIDDAGDVLAREGDAISMGGGNSQDTDGNIAEIAPEDCVADGYWMSGSKVRSLSPAVDPDPAIDNDIGVFFPQWEDEDPDRAQPFAGRLKLDNECLILDHETGGHHRLAIWPPDWSIEADGDDVVLLDDAGDEIARSGDILEVASQFGQFDVNDYGIPGGCLSMHALIFDVEVTGGPEDEMPEAHVQTEDEAREHDARMYAEAFDVDLEEALRRMDLQSRLGDERSKLEHEEADRFGGLHWKHEPEYRLVVLMTDGDEEAVRAYFDDPDLLDVLEVRTVEYTLQELRQTQRDVTELLTELGVRVSSGTSVQENRVEIYVADASIVEDALEAAGESLPDYVVLVEEEEVETLDEPDEEG